jgi:site-specific DNA-cytosine methylase
MGWPDGHTIVANWNGKGNPPVTPRYHRGLAGRAHDRGGVVYTKSRRAQTDTDDETWVEGEVMPTLNSFDVGDVRTTAAILGAQPADDPLLPLGLDSHRYRCCGNGVVAPVAEWIGLRLREALA